MGASENSDFRKCGDLLIDIKKMKYKTKSYTFHCVFCSADCDQLKKFTKHLEEKHLLNFEEILNDDPEQTNPESLNFSYDAEDIKVEPHLYSDDSNDAPVKNKSPYQDPLQTEKSEAGIVNTISLKVVDDPLVTENSDNIPINCKHNEGFNKEPSSCDDINNEVDYENNTINSNDNTIEEEVIKTHKNKLVIQKRYTSDVSTDDSQDLDFDLEMELNRYKKIKKPKKESVKDQNTIANNNSVKEDSKVEENPDKSTKEGEKVKKDINTTRKHMRCKRRWKKIDHSKLPIIIEMYKKNEILWQVNDIAFGILPKRNETFAKMAEDLNSDHNFDKDLYELQDYIDYINYTFQKDREQELKCEPDKTEFKPSSKYYNELSFLSDSQGPFKCSNCGEIIKKYDLYHIHLAEHNGSIPFQCRLCEMGFHKFDNYVRHISRHLGINSYHCDVCGKGYPFKSELEWHLTSHTGVKPFLCPICGAGFRARHGYDNHIRRHEERFRYECHICKRGFNHLCKLNTHIKSHLNIRDIICNVCGKGFTAAKYLHRHKLIHEEEKRYKCNVCDKAFAQDSGLRAHRKQHQPYATIAENKKIIK